MALSGVMLDRLRAATSPAASTLDLDPARSNVLTQ
jgi:hypothetical protein